MKIRDQRKPMKNDLNNFTKGARFQMRQFLYVMDDGSEDGFYDSSETLDRIFELENVNVRSWIFRSIGTNRFLAHPKISIAHEDGGSMLIRYHYEHSSYYQYVIVKDSTSGHMYILQVPPSMLTCRSAIAWTFGLSEQEYNPINET